MQVTEIQCELLKQEDEFIPRMSSVSQGQLQHESRASGRAGAGEDSRGLRTLLSPSAHFMALLFLCPFLPSTLFWLVPSNTPHRPVDSVSSSSIYSLIWLCISSSNFLRKWAREAKFLLLTLLKISLHLIDNLPKYRILASRVAVVITDAISILYPLYLVSENF